MLITDAQVHVWLADSPDRRWPVSGHRYAHGPSYEPAELLADMAAVSVDRAVLVPPSFEGDRNDLCLSAARQHPDRFAVMGRIALSDPGAPAAVDESLDQAGMLGFRVTFGRGLDAAPDDPAVRWFWSQMERHDTPVMVSASAYLDVLPGIIEDHPGLRLAIDRLGVPHGVRGEALDIALDRLCALGRYENVSVKATGLPEMADDAPPFRSVHDRIHRVLDAFGARRVFWGSDLTRMPCDYRSVLRLFTDVLAQRPPAEREWVLGRSVSTWLRWEPTEGDCNLMDMSAP